MANRMSHNLDSRSNTVSWSVRNPAVPSVNNVADDADLASTVTLNSNCPMTQRLTRNLVCAVLLTDPKRIFGWGDKCVCLKSWNHFFYDGYWFTDKPKWNKSSKFLLSCLCLCALTQGVLINGFLPASISTVEKRFNLSSTLVGAWVAMYDVAVLIVLIPLCHYGRHGHKGRCLGVGMLLFALGAFVCTIPQYFSGAYAYGKQDRIFCDRTANNSYCNANDKSREQFDGLAYAFLIVGLFLTGVGASPIYTLGVTYMNENISQAVSPLYMSIFSASSVLGPALGFILGGRFLRIDGDIISEHSNQSALNPADSRWYGAWWLGFLMASMMAVLTSIPLFALPKQLPEAAERRSRDVDQAHQASDPVCAEFGNTFIDFVRSLKVILSNPVFLFLIAVDCLEGLTATGLIAFLPKLIEQFFSLSSSEAPLIAGIVGIPTAALGTFLGGFLMRKFKMLCRQMICMAMLINLFFCIPLVTSFLAVCSPVGFAGVTVRYPNHKYMKNLTSSCNARCNCDPSHYNPVCAFGNLTLYSPCYGGCKTNYFNCNCVGGANVTNGVCSPLDCNRKPIFLTFFGGLVFTAFMTSVPIQLAELRCVRANLQTAALGIRWLLIRPLGTIPGPLLFGKLLDANCNHWRTKCNKRQNCVTYNIGTLSHMITGIGIAVKVVITLCLFAAWKLYNPSSNAVAPEPQQNSVNPATTSMHTY